MRIRTTKFKGAKAEYKETRGPTGTAFLKWRWGVGERGRERFGQAVADAVREWRIVDFMGASLS